MILNYVKMKCWCCVEVYPPLKSVQVVIVIAHVKQEAVMEVEAVGVIVAVLEQYHNNSINTLRCTQFPLRTPLFFYN